MTKDQLEHNLGIIKTELDAELENAIVIGYVEEKLLRLSNVMGLSAECLKWSKRHCLDKQKILMEMPARKGMSATVLKLWLEGEMAEELMLHTYADRLNAGLVHASDQLRTIISKYKEELRIESYGGSPQN